MLGEKNELKNRYMLIGAAIEGDTPTSTPTSSGELMPPLSDNVRKLLAAVGNEEKSLKEMMEATGLKDRKNFIEYTLSPAVSAGLVRMKYPASPRHPRQKYLLTAKGAELLGALRPQVLCP